jgi:uncharacterized protein
MEFEWDGTKERANKKKQGKSLVISFTERSNIIRIISARRMTRKERKAYEQ